MHVFVCPIFFFACAIADYECATDRYRARAHSIPDLRAGDAHAANAREMHSASNFPESTRKTK